MKYPTKEEILEREVKFKEGVILLVEGWKNLNWKEAKKKNPRDKFNSIKTLLDSLAVHYEKPVRVEFTPELQSCCYIPAANTIAINHTCSIISALHEFAHHLFGTSERKACRWSVWLFKKTFTKAFEKLEWNGHMLVKRHE